MAKGIATRSVELESIDRLEEKVKLLVGVVERLRANEARMAEQNANLDRELEALRTRLAASETSNAEVTALREERDVIKSRVDDMLQQIEALNL